MNDALLLSYYGDDFTGSTDVMEALTNGGVPTVLFARFPTETDLHAFPEARAVGMAGESRSRPVDWMDDHLPGIFHWLKSLGARHCHYKVCSTFDSAPQIGSIGRATEIGLSAFGQKAACMVVGAPQLRRYTVFGHLFASYQDEVWRIDRHPVMRRHPVTPMRESDLRCHLAGQTNLQVGLVDPDSLRGNAPMDALDRRLDGGDRVVLIDVYDEASQSMAGDLLDARCPQTGPFVVGSSGVEYALLHTWRRSGQVGAPKGAPTLGKAETIAVVSGSCSPTTGRQIRTALNAGFDAVKVDVKAIVNGQGVDAAEQNALTQARSALGEGKSPIIFTALGPESVEARTDGDVVGHALGRMLRSLMESGPLERVVVAGGDTSSHALNELDVLALTMRRSIPDSPGSPVCIAHPVTNRAPFEIALKGGQVGRDDYFVWLRDGE